MKTKKKYSNLELLSKKSNGMLVGGFSPILQSVTLNLADKNDCPVRNNCAVKNCGNCTL